MYDLRLTKNVAMNFTQEIHQNAIFSGIKCINDKKSEICTAQEYKYSTLITYPDGAEHNIKADKITRTQQHNVKTEFKLLHNEVYSLSVAKTIYSKFLESHKNRGGYMTERSIEKNESIQGKFTKHNKTLGWGDGFKWNDKVCITFKKYDSCISFYGRDPIQIYEYIVLSSVKHSYNKSFKPTPKNGAV